MTAVPTSSSSATSSSAETAKEIKTLLSQLNKSKKKRKKLLHKQQHNSNARDGGREVDVRDINREDAIRLDKLRKIFGELIVRDEFTLSSSSGNSATISGNNSNNKGETNEAKSQWNNWLVKQHLLYTTHLLDDISSTTATSSSSSSNEGINACTSLRTYCGVLASSPVPITGLSDNYSDDKNGSGSGSNKMVSERLLNKLLSSIFKSRTCLDSLSSLTPSDVNNNNEDSELTTSEAQLTQLHSELISQYYDVQYFTYKGIVSIVLELIDGLERLRKLAKENVDEVGGGKGEEKVGEGKEGRASDVGDSDGNNAVLIANAERKVGLVAENICRLLLLMDYVPTKDTQSELEEDMSRYLFVPPVLPSASNGFGGEDYKEEDSEADSSSEDEESTDDDDETSTTNKRKKSRTSNSNKNKRIKKSKLIAWQQSYKHRNALQEAWLSVLRLPNIPVRIQKLVLQHLSNYILKVCPSPLRFAEYFTRVFQGGVESSSGESSSGNVSTTSSLTSILSLHGLFILMLDHQLEYPQYYNSLYKLLHPRILYTKYRTRFLRLLCKSLLSNSMLPAYVVAAFCKKLCRLGLNGPPSGALFVLALVSNLLRKHGECGCLIHRKGKNEDDGLITDVFIENVDDDLIHTRALESSLWELTALEKHYHPAVSTLAKSVGMEDDKTTPMYDMEDFIVHTYKSLFEQEKKRLGGSGGNGGGKKRGGSKVSLTFVKPEGLFKDDDVFGDVFKSS